MTDLAAVDLASPLSIVFGLRRDRPDGAGAVSLTRTAVLRSLYRTSVGSRADVARHAGLARGTVSEVVEGLMAQGLVRESGRDPLRRPGKPATLLELDLREHSVISIDLSAPYRMTVAMVTLAGIESTRIVRDWDEVDALVDLVVLECAQLLRDRLERVVAVSIAMPGVVDDSGSVLISDMVGPRADLIVSMIRQRWPIPVLVSNDANAAAVASHNFDLPSSTLLIRLSKGVGAGLVLDNRVVRGAHHSAGEIGRLRVWSADHASLNEALSVPAIVAGRAVGGSADAEARGVALGQAIAPIVAVMDLPRVVISTAGLQLDEAMLDAVRSALRESLVFPGGLDVVSGRWDGDDVLVGAAAMALAAWIDVG